MHYLFTKLKNLSDCMVTVHVPENFVFPFSFVFLVDHPRLCLFSSLDFRGREQDFESYLANI